MSALGNLDSALLAGFEVRAELEGFRENSDEVLFDGDGEDFNEGELGSLFEGTSDRDEEIANDGSLDTLCG